MRRTYRIVHRHELVPQPHHHEPGEGPSRRPGPNGSGGNRSEPPFPGFPGFGGPSGNGNGHANGNANGGGPGGFLGTLFNTLMTGANTAASNAHSASNNGNTHNGGRSPPLRSNTYPTSQSPRGNNNRPGSSGGGSGERRSTDSHDSAGSGHVPGDRKSTRLNSSHSGESRMPSSA